MGKIVGGAFSGVESDRAHPLDGGPILWSALRACFCAKVLHAPARSMPFCAPRLSSFSDSIRFPFVSYHFQKLPRQNFLNPMITFAGLSCLSK
jgi:hypothetical protein